MGVAHAIEAHSRVASATSTRCILRVSEGCVGPPDIELLTFFGNVGCFLLQAIISAENGRLVDCQSLASPKVAVGARLPRSAAQSEQPIHGYSVNPVRLQRLEGTGAPNSARGIGRFRLGRLYRTNRHLMLRLMPVEFCSQCGSRRSVRGQPLPRHSSRKKTALRVRFILTAVC